MKYNRTFLKEPNTHTFAKKAEIWPFDIVNTTILVTLSIVIILKLL